MTARNHPYITCDWPECASSSDDLQVHLGQTAGDIRQNLGAHGWTSYDGIDLCGHHPLAGHTPQNRTVPGNLRKISCSCGWGVGMSVLPSAAPGLWSGHAPKEQGWCPTAAPAPAGG